jgi:hypothetical protein
LIEISKSKLADQAMRTQIVFVAHQWGYGWDDIGGKIKTRIADAASKLVSYDWGFIEQAASGRTVREWCQAIEQSLRMGPVPMGRVLATKPFGPQKGAYIVQIERKHNGYLHSLYRRAVRIEGAKASWDDIADQMNQLSSGRGESRDTLKLSAAQLRRWFLSLKGKYKANITQPLLTEEKKTQRVGWAEARLYQLSEHDLWVLHQIQERNRQHFRIHREVQPAVGQPYWVVFLDEKWFYTITRRLKNKVLPLGPGDEPGADRLPTDRVASRRHATKVMYMGVVANPVPECGFDGKVLLKRVSETVTASKATYLKLISDDYTENAEIHHKWRTLVASSNGEMFQHD